MGIFPAGTTTLKIGCYVEQPKFNVVSTLQLRDVSEEKKGVGGGGDLKW
jgi:hypothetical protein